MLSIVLFISAIICTAVVAIGIFIILIRMLYLLLKRNKDDVWMYAWKKAVVGLVKMLRDIPELIFLWFLYFIAK